MTNQGILSSSQTHKPWFFRTNLAVCRIRRLLLEFQIWIPFVVRHGQRTWTNQRSKLGVCPAIADGNASAGGAEKWRHHQRTPGGLRWRDEVRSFRKLLCVWWVESPSSIIFFRASLLQNRIHRYMKLVKGSVWCLHRCYVRPICKYLKLFFFSPTASLSPKRPRKLSWWAKNVTWQDVFFVHGRSSLTIIHFHVCTHVNDHNSIHIHT